MYVGLLMLSNVAKIDFNDFVDAMAGLITAVFIVLTCNIVTGIMIGFAALVIGRLVSGEWRKLNLGTVIDPVRHSAGTLLQGLRLQHAVAGLGALLRTAERPGRMGFPALRPVAYRQGAPDAPRPLDARNGSYGEIPRPALRHPQQQ